VLWPSRSWSDSFSQRFDSDIAAAVDRWWSIDPAAPDWLAWKAQLYQESRLDPAVCSPVGACGLAQFMPATWAEVSKALGWRNVSPHSPRHAIFAGAYYMRQLRRFPDWRAAPEPDRHQLAQAAYNAGAGNIRKALRLAIASQRAPRARVLRDFWTIAGSLPLVTGRHARETLTYVDRIARWRNLMRGP
jgi:hypothetical protein